jgi:hypothetical protein
MFARKINTAVLSPEKQAEYEAAKALVKALETEAKGKPKPSCKRIEVKSNGKVGMTLNGLGKPQFFYKEHILALVADTEEAAQIRADIVAWVEANDLTDKE